MSILIATTTITVKGYRPALVVDPDAEGYDPPVEPPAIIATGVRASIAQPKSARNNANVDETDDYSLRCDLFEAGLTRHDTVTDDKTGVEYEVRVAALSPAETFGLQHIKATLRLKEGLSSNAPSNT